MLFFLQHGHKNTMKGICKVHCCWNNFVCESFLRWWNRKLSRHWPLQELGPGVKFWPVMWQHTKSWLPGKTVGILMSEGSLALWHVELVYHITIYFIQLCKYVTLSLLQYIYIHHVSTRYHLGLKRFWRDQILKCWRDSLLIWVFG